MIEHEHIQEPDEQPEFDGLLEVEAQSQIFLEMREQNLELLKVATQVAGYTGEQGPLKPGDLKQALKSIWEIYSEFYAWVDPEEAAEEIEEGDEE